MNRALMQETNDKMGNAFQDMLNNFDKGVCSDCGKPIGTFKDEISYKEYKITGMCQQCQDELFDDDEEDPINYGHEDWEIDPDMRDH